MVKAFDLFNELINHDTSLFTKGPMAGTSLLALIDDITTILDDVALFTKVATQKTAGVVGDDLVVNAEQVTGVRADRELPVVWAVAKGSLVNKAILVPVALAISALAPWAVLPLLMVGGAFLCFEAFEKVAHKLSHGRGGDADRQPEPTRVRLRPDADPVALEKAKIKGAVRTDFILSAEIIVIALGTVSTAAFGTQVIVLVGIGLLMTAGVYGLVAGIVKFDDAGLLLSRREGPGHLARAQRAVGAGMLRAAPWLMRFLSVAGTAAMFLVGGGILAHGIPALHHWAGHLQKGTGLAASLGPVMVSALAGIVAGGLLVGLVRLASRLKRGGPAAH